MSGPQVYFSWPTGDTLPRLPESLPYSIPPPARERSLRSPFGIDKDLYNFALRWQIPFGFAFAYVVTALALNAYNRRRLTANPKTGKKDVPNPWWIARQKPFQWFVVVHNVVLALYSLATFLAMFRAINHTWPGLNNEHGVAGVVDALCKLHGPRGMGDAATYNTTINIWEVKNTLIHLERDGTPDSSDYGRLWNEGLAFWGWIFYASKFYEVLDTLIILAKGRRSPTLQTYHHAGAMLCMWAGIRYMSPPIWMFVFINSGIHAMMYTYYTLSALNIRVPKSIKRTLTSMQIAQFLFGASYAAAHLFVQYDIPVSTSYQVASVVQAAASSASSAAVSATSAVSSFIESPTVTASLGALFKKLLLRAAGEEGVAERIHNDRGEMANPSLQGNIDKFMEKVQQQQQPAYETKWRTDWTKVNCIDTSGEAFAIYLNLFYLTPLTYLFARFFVKAYLSRGRRSSVSQELKATRDDAKTAQRDTKAAFEKTGKKVEELMGEEGEEFRKQVMEDVKKVQDGTYSALKKAGDRLQGKDGEKGSASQGSPSKGGSSGQQTPGQSNPSSPSKKKKKNKNKNKGAQDQNIADSQDIRPGGEDESDAEEEAKKKEDTIIADSQDIRPGETQESAKGGKKDVKKDSDDKEGSDDKGKSDKENDSDEKKDSDAMGQSGSLIDLAASVAKKEAAENERGRTGKEEKETDPSDGAEQDGSQWRPPGENTD